ncbi:hypothetical protein COV19_00305 [Candidatus Woesearchaeota archaeon CG10_big_fil_rev_8_21_14_0_10_44_13]|nr:MAG: hypothetical protein COV19_00305 [Candidatus Woesearchaeota archaeon CG10_big_fil_rev_8_21_14_0_10_44_13]
MYLIPQWFFGYDVLLELLFAFVTLLVAIYAFKVYKLSGENQPLLFGVSFIFISASYMAQSFLNFMIVSELNRDICNAMKLANIDTLNALGIYFHTFFFISGLLFLVYMTLKTKCAKTFSLMFILAYALLWFASNTFYTFYFLSSVLLTYILIHYLVAFVRKKQKRTLLVLVAFAFLLFGSIHFIFSINHSLFYALGHMLGLVAYILILINLIIVINK